MALTLRRWTLLAVCGCLVIAVAYLPPRPLELAPEFTLGTSPERSRVERLNAFYGATNEQANGLRFRDSVAAAVRRMPATLTGPVVQFLGPVSDTVSHYLRARVDHFWRDIGGRPDARLIIRVHTKPGVLGRPVYVLPVVTDGRTCVASLNLYWHSGWFADPSWTTPPDSTTDEWLRRTLGPCAFHAAFGMPGPGVAAWLDARQYMPAYSADWHAAPKALRRLDRRAHEALVNQLPFDALGCMDGDPTACRRAVLATTPNRRLRREIPGLVRNSWFTSFPEESGYLAALVHAKGRERFAAFWTSRAPLETAFQEAFGESLETWTVAWARSIVPDLPPFGPAPRVRAVFLGMILGAAACASAAVYSLRRRVS